MRATILFALAGALAAAPVAAQGDHTPADDGARATSQGMPDGWMMRFDRSNATRDMATFTTMAPGWHVQTGGRGAAIFWQPAQSASGEYRLESTIHLMKPAQHAEAFGVFVGGSDLEAEDQSYLYFLVRQNGQFLIKRRTGATTENVVGWTAHPSVPSAGTEGSTRYDLAIEVGDRTVAFQVNGATVHSMPRSALVTDGLYGLRINHMLDTHVESLQVTGKMSAGRM